MILKNLIPNYWLERKNKQFAPPFGMDSPKNSINGSSNWYNYEIQDYNYKFNNWGFRGEDYEQYKNQPVNICLGDSFTLNIGGPVEHSWPSQLAKNFDIPTLNFGIDGAGNDTIRIVYNYLLEYFDVQNTFTMYSFFHRRYDRNNKTLVHAGCLDDLENFNYFEENKIKNCYYTFIPNWCWSENEKKYINDLYTNHWDFYNEFDFELLNNNRALFISFEKYNKLKGTNWPTYNKFINNSILDDNIYREIFYSKTTYDLFNPTNRDGYHLNYLGNKMVCDYFLFQVNRTP